MSVVNRGRRPIASHCGYRDSAQDSPSLACFSSLFCC